MTLKEQRHQIIGQKVRNAATLPFFIIAHSKLLLTIVVILVILFGIVAWGRIAPAYNRVRCEIAGWGYLPDGEYHGQMDGSPVTLLVDRGQTTDDGRASIVEVRDADGGSVPLYLFFENGSVRLHASPPGFLSCRGDIVERSYDGQYSVSTSSSRDIPWLTFSAVS